MAREKFKVGDKIRVIGYRPGVYPPGIEDDMGTEALFKELGRTQPHRQRV